MATSTDSLCILCWHRPSAGLGGQSPVRRSGSASPPQTGRLCSGSFGPFGWPGGPKAWLFGIALLPQLSALPWILEQTPPGFTVLITNVKYFSGQTNQLQQFLSSWEVDAIVQIEKRVSDIPNLQRVADDFEPELPRVSHHIGVYCRAPQDCTASVSPQIGSASMAMSYATLRIKPNLCLVAVHAPPPVPIDASGMRPYIEHLVQHIDNGRIITEWGACKQGDAAVIAGDFNAVAGSWPHRTLLARGLKDRLWMRGLWANSWPMEDISSRFRCFGSITYSHPMHSSLP